MFQATQVCRKNPIVLKFGEGLVSKQLKHILNKKPTKKFDWDPIPQYPPRKLRHADRVLNPKTGAAVADPSRDNTKLGHTYVVPDQQYHRIPVPHRYKDAYWWREQQARRIQTGTEDVSWRFWDARQRDKYSFMDLSFEEKFYFSADDVVAHARQERR